MKHQFPYHKTHGPKCEVWKNAPFEPRHLHSGQLTEHVCSDGKKIIVCPRCKVDMENLKCFLGRKTDARRMSGIPIRDFDEERREDREQNKRDKELKRKEMASTISQAHREKIYLLHQRVALMESPSMGYKQIAKETKLGRGIVLRIANPARWHELHPRAWLKAERQYARFLQNLEKGYKDTG